MDVRNLMIKINQLEYHQSLMLQMIKASEYDFYKLVINHSLQKEDVEGFYQVCDQLTKSLEQQKAEGFVYFHPLFENFKTFLHPNLNVEEVINACIRQQLYMPLMTEFKKYL